MILDVSQPDSQMAKQIPLDPRNGKMGRVVWDWQIGECRLPLKGYPNITKQTAAVFRCYQDPREGTDPVRTLMAGTAWRELEWTINYNDKNRVEWLLGVTQDQATYNWGDKKRQASIITSGNIVMWDSEVDNFFRVIYGADYYAEIPPLSWEKNPETVYVISNIRKKADKTCVPANSPIKDPMTGFGKTIWGVWVHKAPCYISKTIVEPYPLLPFFAEVEVDNLGFHSDASFNSTQVGLLKRGQIFEIRQYANRGTNVFGYGEFNGVRGYLPLRYQVVVEKIEPTSWRMDTLSPLAIVPMQGLD